MTLVPVEPRQLTPLPAGPRPTDPVAVFKAKAFDTVLAQEAMIPELNEVLGTTYTNALYAKQEADRAGQQSGSAATSATQARQSELSAQDHATNSQTAAQHSSTFAQDAELAKQAAQLAEANFNRLYLGPKTEVPTTDNQGQPLLVGAWFTYVGANAGLKGWHWWDGQVWVLGVGDVAGSFMPKAGGTFEGHISVPSGASGSQAISAKEAAALARVPMINKFIIQGETLAANTRYVLDLSTGPSIALHLTSTPEVDEPSGSRIELVPVGDVLASNVTITVSPEVVVEFRVASGSKLLNSTQGLSLDSNFSKLTLEKVWQGRWLALLA